MGDLTVEEIRELVGNVVRESGEVADLVEDLLVAARADMGNISIGIQALAVRPELDQVIAGLVDRPANVDCSDVDGSVLADPLRFKQILRNLMTNAVRYGGPRIRAQSVQTDGVLCLSICDNGPGIDEDRHDAIFELYERDSSKPTLTTSVGVGLTVSRQLARLMGGDVTYEYSGGWSRFRLELPGLGVLLWEVVDGCD